MLFVVIFTALYVIVFFADVLPLKKKNKKKEFVIVTIMVSVIYVLQILDVLGINLPRPTKGVKLLVSLWKRLAGK
ncbi:MAG: hypothetical protein GX166_06020 [Clostridiaceae bacterium]|jgi:hypothetical protein|nr:hypothetical protein [Clostridiaceae bacterium]